MAAAPNQGFTSQNDSEDAQNFIMTEITEDELYSASDDVDLLESSPIEADTGGSAGSFDRGMMEAMDELEITTSNLVSSSTFLPNDDANIRRGNASTIYDNDEDTDEETDDDDHGDESTFGIHIDEEIVNNVLESSDDRIRQRENEEMKKCCRYGILAFAAFVIFIAVVDSDLLMRREIQNHGSAYHYDDRENFPSGGGGQEDEQMIMDQQVDIGSAEYAKYFYKAAPVMGPAFDPSSGEVPFFFQIPSVCSTLEETLSQCLGLVIASNKPGPPQLQGDELIVYDLGEENERGKYINVDLSNGNGIKRAETLNLASSGLPDVIMTGLLHLGLNSLFSTPGTKARMFTVVRHPVDLAISFFYDFTQNAVEETLRTMTFDEFVDSNYYLGNFLTRIISGHNRPESPSEDQLHLSEEILRSKFIVGLHDELAESITLFEDYFYWENGNSAEAISCKRDHKKAENQRELDMFHEVGNVKAGNPVYQRIVEKNSLDLELYWYSVDLHRAQRSWIPHKEEAQ